MAPNPVLAIASARDAERAHQLRQRYAAQFSQLRQLREPFHSAAFDLVGKLEEVVILPQKRSARPCHPGLIAPYRLLPEAIERASFLPSYAFHSAFAEDLARHNDRASMANGMS